MEDVGHLGLLELCPLIPKDILPSTPSTSFPRLLLALRVRVHRALPSRSLPALSNSHATHLQRDFILGWFAVEGAFKLSCRHASRRIKRQIEHQRADWGTHPCHDDKLIDESTTMCEV